ncbi:MAG: O-methyltransferase [Bdellovibrionales bacterium]|nr:O-methyltransferase [Bdellovibrionales bacterium]
MRVGNDEEKYLNEVFGLSDADLLAVKAELERAQLNFMSISTHEARMLQFLIRLSGARKVVEVGTLFGFSALAMAKALPSDGRVFTLDNNRTNWEVAQKGFQAASEGRKITSLCGEGQALLAEIEKEGPFDMCFIDANKGGYCGYLDWAEKNVRQGGLIVGDNTFLWGGVYGQPRDRDIGPNQIRVMKEFNQRLADPSRYNSTMIPTSEGLTVGQKLF